MLKQRLWLDFETRSRVPLKTEGAYRYVECPDHQILIAGYALGDGPTKAAIVANGAPWPVELRNMLADPKIQIACHNAAFDRLQLKQEAPPIDRWYCTATQARAMALPGKLEDLGRAIGSDIRKDPRGAQLIQLLSIPQADGAFCNDPALLEEFRVYCARDIATMRAVSLAMPGLRDFDQQVYHASERINDRGMPIDRELCRLATQYAAAEAVEAAGEVIRLSAGAVRSVKGTTLTKWVYDRLGESLRKHMEVHKSGEKRLSLAADIRATLLELAEEEPEAFHPDVVAMIEAAEAGAMSSTAKFQTMLNRCSADGRLRGAFVMNGASQTGRYSSTGAQLHNFPRECAVAPEHVLRAMRAGVALPGVLKTLKSMLRPAIMPKAGVIVRCDWSAIEARGLPWLVGAPADEYLSAFSVPGRDIYVEQSHAAGLGGERQPGKVVVLSLGYGGGEGALARMANNYGVSIDDKQGVVARWRRANDWVAHKGAGWWASLTRCSMRAMASLGETFHAGRVGLRFDGYALTLLLPSGRTLYYPQAALEAGAGKFGDDEISYLKAGWKPKADALEWPRGRLWHGILAENATQAICADLLREAIVRADRGSVEVIGHVHDELITEAPTRKAKDAARELRACMLTAPAWAGGFPLAAETDVSPRYRK